MQKLIAIKSKIGLQNVGVFRIFSSENGVVCFMAH